MGTQGTGRKRSTKKERSTAEDDALNLIAREAEARLAAKRAARAEAREIRMKELERQQKELSDEDERMSVGSRGSVRVEDRDYLEKGSRAASALTAATLTSVGGSSSRRGSGETSITVEAETSIRDIKDSLAEVEEKYRKAMVSNAQLDNEKNNLMYQVDTLKDSLMELEELLSESRREYDEKVKEYEREKHAHSVLQFQYNEMKETLKQSEELLNKHGIVLGPDLNVNGDSVETQADSSPSEDPSSPSAQESQTAPTEGNSMLGNTKEQHQDVSEKVKERPSGSETISNVAEEQKTNVAAKEDSGQSSIPKVKEMFVRSNSLEKIVEETETAEGEGLVEGGRTSNQDLGETGDTCEETKQPQSDVGEDVKESLPSVSAKAQEETETSKTEEIDKDKDSKSQGTPASGKKKKKKKKGKKKAGTNEEGNQQKDGAGKEKGKTETGPQSASLEGTINARFCCWPVTETLKELKGNQVKNKQDKPKGKEVGAVEAEKASKSVDLNENVKESQMDQVTDENSKEQTLETETAGEVEVLAPVGTIGELQEFMDEEFYEFIDKRSKEQILKTEPAKVEEAPATVETFPQVETDLKKDDEEQKLEEAAVEVVGFITSPPPEDSLSAPDSMNGSSDAELTEEVAKVCASKEENTETDDVTEELLKEQTTETENVKEVEEVETTATPTSESPAEVQDNHVTKEQKDKGTLDTETAEAAEVTPPAETLSHVNNLQESKTDSPKDEPDKEVPLETAEVEEESTTNPGSETNFSASDFEDSIDTESSGYPANRCTSSEDNSDMDNSTNSSVIQSELVDSSESESGSITEMKAECTTHNPRYGFETIYEEPSQGDGLEESQSTHSPESSFMYSTSTDGLSDCQQSLSGSEQPPELIPEHVDVDTCSENTLIEVSERGSEEETETVIDLGESRAELPPEPANVENGSVKSSTELPERDSEEVTEKDKDQEEPRPETANMDSGSIKATIKPSERDSEEVTEKDKDQEEPRPETTNMSSDSNLTPTEISERCSEEETEGDKDQEEPRSEPADVNSSSDNPPTETSERGLEEKSDTVKDPEEQPDPADVDSGGDNIPIIMVSIEEETKTVMDGEEPKAETVQEPSPPVLDADHSESVQDRTDEKLNGDLGQPEGSVEPDSSSHDKTSDASDSEKSAVEAVVQSNHEVETQTLQTDEPHAGPSCETVESSMIEVLDAPDSEKEGDEISLSNNQDQSTEGSVPEDLPGQTDSQTEAADQTHFLLLKHRQEPLKDRSETVDSDEENSVDEEGQSFDFDDLDIDDAIAANVHDDPKQIAIMEGVEVMSRESKSSLDLTQSNAESLEIIEDRTGEGHDRLSVDGSQLHPESDAISQDTLNSWAHGDTSSENLVEDQANILEEVGVTEDPGAVKEERKALKVSQKSKKAKSPPLEEGLDPLNNDDSVSLKSWDVVSSNTETLPSGRSSRKGSKKSKGKSKEDCKMS